MEFLDKKLDDYIEAHSTPESQLLQNISRETFLEVMMPRMLSGHVQGNALRLIASMISPSNILEIGTYTGYSAICLAQGLREGGKLYTIDINAELENRVRRYFDASGLAGAIDFRIGDATQIIPTLDVTFDLVFIDADKINYPNYYDLVFPKVRKGGFIIADNVLWSGKVLEEKTDKDTQAIQAYNDKIQNDPRVFNTIFSIRDGLMVAQKISD